MKKYNYEKIQRNMLWFSSLTISVRMNSKKINKQNYEKLKCLGLLEIIAVHTELTVCFRQN